MKRKVLLSVIAIILCMNLYAHNNNGINLSKEDYFIGSGFDMTPFEANEMALNDLINIISVYMEENFATAVDNKNDISSYSKRILQSYINEIDNQALTLDKNCDIPDYYMVSRCIKKDELVKIFSPRLAMIHEFVQKAVIAEENLKIGDALKYYYWSLCLVRTHPDMDKINGKIEEMQGLLLTELPKKINRIINTLKIQIISSDYNRIEKCRKVLFKIKYKDLPIGNLDYKYFTGSKWTEYLTTVNNGIGIVEYWGAAAKYIREVRLDIEYKYEFKSNVDPNLNQVISTIELPEFSNSKTIIKTNCVRKAPTKYKAKMKPQSFENQNKHFIDTVIKFINAYNTGLNEIASACLSPKGEVAVEKLLYTNEAKLILERNNSLECYQLNDLYIVRSIPFILKNDSRHHIENVVFILDNNARICGLTYAINDITLQNIMEKNDTWGSLEQKRHIIHFMETYKTAYYLKDIHFIENIFSEGKLITPKRTTKGLMLYYDHYSSKMEQDFIEFNKLDFKDRLERISNNSPFLNIQFETVDIQRVQQTSDYIYGIQIAQYYYSRFYIEFLNMFFMIDLNDPCDPKIRISSIQQGIDHNNILGLKDFLF